MPRGHGGDDVWVKCHGRYWKLRSVPASTWIQAVLSTDMAGIWPGLVRDRDAEQLYGLWLTEDDMQNRAALVSRRALGRAAGREWHWAHNLIKEIDGSWTWLNGLLVREGVRADQTGLSDYLDAAFTLFSEKLKPDDFKAMETRLRKLPSGIITKPRMSSRDDLMKFAKD